MILKIFRGWYCFLGDNNTIDKQGKNRSDNIVGGPEDFVGNNILDTDSILSDTKIL